MSRLHKSYVIIFLASILLAIFRYKNIIDFYFFQDDFFELNISTATSIKEYLSFFLFRNDIIAYRPISLQNYFFLTKSIFGLNPAAFRFVTLLLFVLNAFLISKVIGEISKNAKVGLLTGAFWVLSSIHFMSIVWIAAAYNIIGTFFYLLTSLIFLKFLKTNAFRYYALSLIIFLITIGSFEFSVTWPIIFGIYLFVILNKNLSWIITYLLPYILISAAYLVLRTLFIKVPTILEYSVTFNIDSVKAFFWYVLWTFNIPEEFKKQIVNNLIMFNGKFVEDYKNLMLISFIGGAAVVFFSVIIPASNAFIKKRKINLRLILFLTSWFLFSIAPVILLPNHTFTMYLTLSSIGLYAIVSYLLVKESPKLILPVLLIWIVTSASTINFYKDNSWMVEAQKTARNFSHKMQQLPSLPKNSVVLYELNSQAQKQALLGNNAIKVMLNDQSLSIYYNKEELINDFNSIKGNRIYYIHK